MKINEELSSAMAAATMLEAALKSVERASYCAQGVRAAEWWTDLGREVAVILGGGAAPDRGPTAGGSVTKNEKSRKGASDLFREFEERAQKLRAWFLKMEELHRRCGETQAPEGTKGERS